MADKIGGTSRHDGSYTCCCLMMLHITILMDGEMNMEMSRLIFVTKQSLLWFAWRVCMEPGSPGKTAGTPGQREIPTIFWRAKNHVFPLTRRVKSLAFSIKKVTKSFLGWRVSYYQFIYLSYLVQTYDKKRHFRLLPVRRIDGLMYRRLIESVRTAELYGDSGWIGLRLIADH